MSGLWAVAECMLLVIPGAQLKEVSYVVGLIVGLATVGAWLYFCSAYTGHTYHRRQSLRRLAVGVYATIVLIKITNPIHQLYFTSTLVTDPFPYLAVTLSPAHWVVTGLSYALTAIGFYLLYELFSESRHDTRVLSGLVAATALPAVFDLLTYTDSIVLSLNYEPIGVAVFAVGVLYVVDEQFVALPAFWRQEILETLTDPVIVLDQVGVVRDYNQAAVDAFPELVTLEGAGLEGAYPGLSTALTGTGSPIEVTTTGETRYFATEHRPLSIEDVVFGQVVILSDVTEVERHRRELQRQNDQFDEFSEAITHELRNTIAIADGYLKMLGDRLEEYDDSDTHSYYEKVSESLGRMESVVGDLSKLAQFGQTLDNTEPADVEAVVDRGWSEADTGSMTLTIESREIELIRGDQIRLVDLFRSLFEFARATGSKKVAVALQDGVIDVRTDGRQLSAKELERAFEYGEAIPSAESGMLLPNIQTIAAVHGWAVDTDSEYEGGVRIRIVVTDTP